MGLISFSPKSSSSVSYYQQTPQVIFFLIQGTLPPTFHPFSKKLLHRRNTQSLLSNVMGRTSWSDDNSRTLLNILNEEKNRGVSKFKWGNIANIFNVQKKCNVTGKQVQNHYTDLKERYKCWEELQGLTGISFNPITKKADVEERSLERYNAFIERNSKYGVKIIKQELANLDEMSKLFDGKFAHGVGGCFSPAMAKGQSYLTRKIHDLTIDEPSQDNEMSGDDVRKPCWVIRINLQQL